MTTKNMTPEEEYEAAFAEAAAARLGNKADGEQAPAEPAAEAAPAADDASGQETPPQPGTEAAGEAEPKPEADPVEELKRKLAEAEHRERSASNRISAFHKKLNEAQAKVAELERKLTAPPQPKPSEPDPELQNLLAEMPELGKVVEKLVAQRVSSELDPLQEKIQRVEAQGRPAIELAEREAIRREIAPVDEAYPEWRKIVFGEDGKISAEWSSWLETKSPAIRGAYAQVTTAQDAIDFLEMYHRDKGISPPQAEAGNPPPKPKPKTDLARAVGIPSKPTAAPLTGAPAEDDFEGSFKFFAEKRMREQAAYRR